MSSRRRLSALATDPDHASAGRLDRGSDGRFPVRAIQQRDSNLMFTRVTSAGAMPEMRWSGPTATRVQISFMAWNPRAGSHLYLVMPQGRRRSAGGFDRRPIRWVGHRTSVGPAMVLPQMARHQMPRRHLAQHRRLHPAPRLGISAARMEVAPRRRIDRARHIARPPAACARFSRRIGQRHRGEQRLGVGMQRPREQRPPCPRARRSARDTSPRPGG